MPGLATPPGPPRADELAAGAPQRGWQRLSAGQGSKGHRLDDWLLIDPGADEQHLLLVRRSISKPSELAYYVCHSPTPGPLAELIRGRRIPVGGGGNLVRHEALGRIPGLAGRNLEGGFWV
jgi:hypothetical protein